MLTSVIRCGWRTAAVSEAGVSHIQNGVDCQDSSLVHVGTKWLIACVADGAGSAIHSKEGARTAVESFVEVAADLLRCRYDPETTVRNAFDQARLGVSKISGCETEKYATTLLGVVATRNRVAAAQVGDGAIIIDGQVVLKGHAGEYANETSFITQDEVAPQLFVSKVVRIQKEGKASSTHHRRPGAPRIATPRAGTPRSQAVFQLHVQMAEENQKARPQ